jgi:AcrR family transcriptional regulator
MAARALQTARREEIRVDALDDSPTDADALASASRRLAAPGWHMPTPGGSHPQLAEIQRARLLSATVRAVDELGYANTSVAHITGRARVSRRTFYELFPDREACIIAALEDIVALIERELMAAEVEALPWSERVRIGLWTMLSFFDREPVLARVCVVQAMRGGPAILERREAILARLVAVLDGGRPKSAGGAERNPLLAEGLVGAVFSILYTRLARGDAKPLHDLFGELIGLIMLPYLGPAAARREQQRPVPAPLPDTVEKDTGAEHFASDPLEGVPIRLTYRTTRVLECVAAQPGASNRQLADAANISDQGQASKLLARLQRVGLLENTGKDRPEGEANAWELTPAGRQLTQVVAMSARNGAEASTVPVSSRSPQVKHEPAQRQQERHR